MRLILIFGGLHLCVIALGGTMLLLFLREGRLGSSDEDEGRPPGGGDPPPPDERPTRPPPGGSGLRLTSAVPARVRLRGEDRPWPRPGRLRTQPCDPRPARTRPGRQRRA